MTCKIAFGLDLAGYSTGRSALAKATFDENAGYRCVIYRRHAFANVRQGQERLAEQFALERALLPRVLPLYVDVPIDLQGLPTAPDGCVTGDVAFVWQLTKRPVDFAFDALPPLADRLGAPVARLAGLMRGCDPAVRDQIFETYPAGSLGQMFGPMSPYKRQAAQCRDGRWTGDDGIVGLLDRLEATADDGTRLNDDDLDAALCALTGVLPAAHLLESAMLAAAIQDRLAQKLGQREPELIALNPPARYVLIGKPLPRYPLHFSVVDAFPPD
jgi:hypothetical protein